MVRSLVQVARVPRRRAYATSLVGLGPATAVRPTPTVPVALAAARAVAVGPKGQAIAPVGVLGAQVVAGPLDPSAAPVTATEAATAAVAAVVVATSGDGLQVLGSADGAAATWPTEGTGQTSGPSGRVLGPGPTVEARPARVGARRPTP